MFQFERNYSQKSVRAEGSVTFSDEQWIVALMGPSGVGKSSLVRWMAGLTRAGDRGRLEFDKTIWFDTLINAPPPTRNIGLLSQADVLFPHLTVRENILFSLRRSTTEEKETRLQELVSRVHFAKERLGVKPAELSGGEKRRIALAQTLAKQKSLLLLDEPFTGLDREAKKKLWNETREFIEHEKVPTLLITHDEDEARAFTDRVFNFENGRLKI